MYSERTTIVDVKQTGESEYTLSMTAGDLYVRAKSGDVIRRHDVSAYSYAPEHKYVDLSGVKFDESDGSYTFTFASGDVFTASSPDDYPTSESLSDAAGGGGSPLIVRCTVSDNEFVLSEDWDTINEAFTEAGRPVLIEFFNSGTKSSSTYTYRLVTEVGSVDTTREAKSSSGNDYFVVCTDLSNVDFNFKYIFHSDTSSGTLSCSEALTIGGGGGGGSILKVGVTETPKAR